MFLLVSLLLPSKNGGHGPWWPFHVAGSIVVLARGGLSMSAGSIVVLACVRSLS